MTLHFKDYALASFRFLESDYSFTCVSAEEGRVRYESESVFVEVLFDGRRSFELDIGIGQRNVLHNGRERPFNMGEVLRAKGVEKAESYTFLQASTQERLQRAIERLSELLKKYGPELLKGSPFAFKSVAGLRVREGERYALDRDLKRIRREAQEAWKSKDFAKVVALYRPVEAHLSVSEVKKLEYADKHCS